MSNETAIASLKEKIDDLNQHAWEVRVTDLPKSFELSQESVKLARTINYPKGLADGLRSLGFSYVRFSKNDEAAPLLKESLSLFQSLNDLKGQAVIYEYLGIIERNWGNLGASLDLLLKANELVLQIDSQEIEITCNYQLGVTYKHLGDHENALDYLYKTLSLAKKMNFALMEAYATNIIGSIYFDNGNYNQALDCYQQGLPIRRQSHDKWGEAGSLDNIGFTYLKLNDLDKAIDHCKQSLAICQATGDKKGEANALLHLGEIYEQAGDIKQAADFSNKSLEIRKERGDKRGETEVLLFLAELYKNRNDVEDHQIFEWLSNALKIADEVKAQDLLSKTHYNLHEYYQQKGNYKESLVQLEAHFQIEKELHKNSINQKIANLEISHKAEVVSQRNKELTELNEKIEKANEELKIESSLEKVRSRSLAMHKSEELREVVSEVFEKLAELMSMQMDGVSILIPVEGSKDIIEWVASEGKTYPEFFRTPYIDNPILTTVITARDSGVEFLTKVFDYEEKNALWKYAFEHSGYKNLPEEMKKRILESRNYAYSVAFQKNSAIVVASIAGQVLSEDESEILKRFAKVFEQAYIRFLDLQKAEAQAKEAQIQLALERVRARTMAMHHSGELADTASELFQQIKELGFETWSCGFCIWTKNDLAEVWMAADSGGLLPPMMIPYKEEPTHSNIYEASLRKELAHDKVWEGKELERHYTFLKTIPSVKEAIEILERSGLSLPLKQCYYVGFFKQGYLLLITKEPNEDLKDLSKRFAKVFEQTYTRFLDLQKAEAYAREAQVELGLERVRARAMAMHGSDELKELVKTLFEELIRVDVNLSACLISTFDISSLDEKSWMFHPVTREPYAIRVPSNEQPFYHEMLRAWRERNTAWNYCLEGETKVKWHDFLFADTGFALLPQSVIDEMRKPDKVFFTASYYSYGAIQVASVEPFPAQSIDIIQRFSKVFDSSYTRFLDLQKAEAQARESQIQLAMERVRARTMAMQRSEELAEVATILFQQVKALGVSQWVCGFSIWEIGDKEFTWYPGILDGETLTPCKVPLTEHPVFISYDESRLRGDELFVYEKEGEFQADHYRYMMSVPGMREQMQKILDAGLSIPTFQIDHIANFSHGNLIFITYEPVPEMHDVFKRFAKIFEQTYTRFLDLQKAEAQSREAQIELALERVRARTMAMQRSYELREAVLVIYEQLQQLNFDSKACNIIIIDKESGSAQYWVSGFSQEIFPKSYTVPYLDHPYYDALLNPWKEGDKYVVYEYAGQMKKSWDKIFFTQTEFRNVPEEAKKIMIGLESVKLSTAFISYGALQALGAEPLSEEKANILKRFAKVFEQTYTRFLDLQKAEAQAREAKIENALEKVRSRTMAMQRSDELADVAQLLFQQVKDLGIEAWTTGFNIWQPDNNSYIDWITGPTGDFLETYTVDATKHEVFAAVREARQRGDDFFVSYIEGEQVKEVYQLLSSFGDKGQFQKILDSGIQFPTRQYNHIVFGAQVSLLFVTYEPYPEAHDIFKRFGKVFEQTYTRFLDLQKAEAQARESQIEAALEKIRSRSLAMHQSKELKEVIAITFEKLNELNVLLGTVAIQLFDKKSMHSVLWVGNTIQDPQMVDLPYDKQMMLEDTLLKDSWQAMIDGVDIVNKEYSVEQKNKYFNYLFSNNNLTQIPEQAREVLRQMQQHIACLFVEKNSAFLVDSWKGEFFPKENLHVLKRAAKVFEQAYIRFLDLQKAEAQAREAQIEAALERVRSRTMGMQKSDELKDVIKVVYEQFVHLNINIEHTGFVMDYKARDDYDIWIADKLEVPSHLTIPYFDCVYYNRFNEAKKKGEDFFATNLDFDEKNRFYKKIIEYVPGLPEETKEFLFSIPGLAASTVLLDNVCLYIENFAGTPYSDEENATLMRFGKVFQQTYTRFNDLKLAEAHAVQAEEDLIKLQTEKKRAEDALSELQVTQKQLIQSEKMASLGELTAGIAHEIQNPLNFVNNFSDVNKELLVEMKEEIEKGNTEEVIAIANDIISNEEKINHHGKRADAIVKGMLQHSRSSSGVKEPTDINELADEYLRLAYHGLRAKDKSFNATMKTDFDQAIGKVNVIPQEIGRVFLNLITNAFYVVAEKKKQLANGYEPTVTVTTKKENDKIVVSVKDNGSGMSQKVLDKIFQPFFTTKPTGQGTGLGLSLSYDIVKAHSGEIKVKTKDGEGSEFVISLPV